MIKVAIELVHAAFAEFADFRVKEDAVGVVAERKEFADRRVGCNAYGLVVLNGND